MTLVERLSTFLSNIHTDGPEDAFYEHVVRARSQYDEQYRRMATEILAARHLVKEAACALHIEAVAIGYNAPQIVAVMAENRRLRALEARDQRVVAEADTWLTDFDSNKGAKPFCVYQAARIIRALLGERR